MTVLEIVELSIIVVAILATVIYCVVMGVKNKWFSQLYETIKVAIKEAEAKYPDAGQGDEKKKYVLQKVEAKCKELGVPYNFLKKLIDIAIDNIIADYNIISK